MKEASAGDKGKLTALQKQCPEILFFLKKKKKDLKGDNFYKNSQEIFCGDHPIKKGWNNKERGKLKATQMKCRWWGNLRICSYFLLLVLLRRSLLLQSPFHFGFYIWNRKFSQTTPIHNEVSSSLSHLCGTLVLAIIFTTSFLS